MTEEPGEDTAIIPATNAAALDPANEAGRTWFDQRLRDFVHALACDAQGRSRPTEIRLALAAAAQQLIARIANQRPATEPAPNWPRDAVLQPDQMLAGTFEVRSLLASGGIGQIYRVRHRDLRTDHAVKILQPRHMLDPVLSAMLMEEARLLTRVRHAGVVGGLGLLRDGDGRLLLVMDHIRGGTLASRLAGGALPLAEVVGLARRLVAALGAVHDAGVVHNDIAPDNVILRDDRVRDPILVDFGLAEATERDTPRPVSLDFAGKLSWVSPERLVGGPDSKPDARSDLYALGLVLAAASRGQRLAMGQDRESALAARRNVPPLDGVAPALHPLLTALLDPVPAARPATCAEIAGLLDLVPERPAGEGGREGRSFIALLTRRATDRGGQRTPGEP